MPNRFRSLAATTGLLLSATAVLSTAVIPAARAQRSCQTVVAYTPPSSLRCQQIGEDHLRRPIWLCC